MWRSENEMLEVVRRQAAGRQLRRRFLTATAAAGVVVAVAVGAVAVGGDRGPREIRVAGAGVGGSGGAGGGAGGGPAVGAATEAADVEGAGGNLADGSAPSTSRPTNVADPVAPAISAGPRTTTTVDGYEPPRPTTTVPPSPGSTTATSSEPGSLPPTGPDTPVGTSVPPRTDPIPPSPSPGRVAVVPNAVDLRPRPFDTARAVNATLVSVRFWSGVAPCDVVGRVDVTETADAVTITLYSGREPSPEPQACIAIATYNELLVELPSALAGRAIVDGAA